MMAADRRGIGLEGKNVVALGVAEESSLAWLSPTELGSTAHMFFVGYQQKFSAACVCCCYTTVDWKATAATCGTTIRSCVCHRVCAERLAEPSPATSAEAFCQGLTISAHSLSKTVGFAKPCLPAPAWKPLESAVRHLALQPGLEEIRVNTVSPGPIKTQAVTRIDGAFLRNAEALEWRHTRAFEKAVEMAHAEDHPDASAGASGVRRHFQGLAARRCAIEEGVSKEDVADSALFLGNDYSRPIAGQAIHLSDEPCPDRSVPAAPSRARCRD